MTHFLQRTALIALATTALTACSTTENQEAMRPSYPIRQPEAPVPTAPPPAANPTPTIDSVQPPPAAAPVQSKPLEPLPPAQPPALPPPSVTPPPVSRPAPRPAPKPVFETVTKKAVTGKVVEVEGKPVSYTVKKGDTLEKIAKKLDTTIDDLKRDNKLKKSAIQPGQELKGPTSSAKAYVVGQGDTLYSIARRFSVTPDSLIDENNLSSKASLRNGQKLRLPDGYKDKGPLVTTSRVQVSGGEAAQSADDTPPAPTPVRRTGRNRPTQPPAAEVDEGPAPEAPAPSYRTVTSRSVTGRVVEVEGRAVTYTVKKGDNLEKIAKKLDTTVDDLKDDNKLKKSAIHPGQVLKGPRSTAKAYVAGADDTLGDIAKRFGVSVEDLRSENGLSRRATIRAGQKLRLPDDYRDHGPIVTRTRVAVPTATPRATEPEPVAAPPTPTASSALPSSPRPYTPSSPRPYTPPPASRPYAPPPSRSYTPPPSSSTAGAVTGVGSAPTPSDAQISDLGRGRFQWPLQGAIVSDFGPKTGGQRNDGINIGARAGEPVRAAAAGDVVYAGDQVPGFGNLVLIKHADGWVTAYGHLSRVEVKMQQKVTQGQQIGQAGATGGVSEPQLHFEVRYASSPLERARPVDPKLVLPK